MTIPQKCIKLLQRLDWLVSDLSVHREYTVHHQINQFFYQQKAVEIRLVLEQIEEAQSKLEIAMRWMDENYESTYCQWRKDVRWLNRYRLDNHHWL